jgi:hypothetical protein
MAVPKSCPRCQKPMSSWVYTGKNESTGKAEYMCEGCAAELENECADVEDRTEECC